jgi:hypothetical protein
MAPPLAQSSPPGKEEQGRRESEGRERFKKQKEANLTVALRESPEREGAVNEPSSSEPATVPPQDRPGNSLAASIDDRFENAPIKK